MPTKKLRTLTFYLLTLLLLLGLSACRLDMEQEIWLNEDNSGKALISTTVVIPKLDDMEGMEEGMEEGMGSESPLDEMAVLVADTPGATLIDSNRYDNSTDEEINLKYFLEFSFDKPETLAKIILTDPEKGIQLNVKGKDKTLVIDPRAFSLQETEEYSEYLDFLDMNMSLKLHLPKKVKELTPVDDLQAKGKDLSWSFKLDSEWYAENEHPISIKY